VTTPLAALLLVGLAAPLVLAIVKRLRERLTAPSVLQTLVMTAALVLVGLVVYVSVWRVGMLGDISDSVRKDVVIYIIGGLVWYGPAFGISAGVWRRTGLV
jgi:ABC-type tungstate transport system substrate-binding protein